MNENYALIIIGAGASGMMAAIAAARVLPDTSKVLVLEKGKRAGRKLLATGNGRCNLSNINAGPDCYYGSEARFARGPLHRFSVAAVLSLFEELGLKTRQDSEGRIYPLSNQAATVLDIIRLEMHRLNIVVKTEQPVSEIIRSEPLYLGKKPLTSEPAFSVKTSNGKIYTADAVVLATGGLAAPALGGTEDGYKIAAELGHDLITPFPALVPLCLQSPICKRCSGIRFEAIASIKQEGKILEKNRGEFLWTNYGISGIAAMELSRTYNAVSNEIDTDLEFDFLPDMSEEELRQWLRQRIDLHPDLICESVLTGLMHRRLGEELVKAGVHNSVVPTLSSSRLTEEHIDSLINTIKGLNIKITGSRDWDQAQITAGGLDVRLFYPDSMESRICSGFFAAGEVLDIDASCGGFNLQWAWSSGWIAGFRAAGHLLKQEAEFNGS